MINGMTNLTVSHLVTIRKVRLVWAFAVLAAIAGVLFLSGGAQADSLGFSLNSKPLEGTNPEDLSVLVLDDETGKALSDATVSVGDSLLDGSATSFREITGATGAVLIRGALARGPRAMTVARNGYASLSLLGLQSAQVTIQLKSLPSPQDSADPTVLAMGEMADWPNVPGGNTLTAGIVFKSLSAFDLLSFSADSFISPLKDSIDVMGKREIPSNFVLPTQDLTVFFMPVRLSKPHYRLPVARGKPVRLAGIQGSIPVSDLLGAVQGGTGKMPMTLLNRLTFTQAGVAPVTTPANDFSTTVDANLKLKPQHQVTPVAAPFAADILVAAATDLDGTRTTLLPTDVKLAADMATPSQIKTVKLSAPDPKGRSIRNVLTIALTNKGHRVSGIVTASAGARVSPGTFLDAVSIADVLTVPNTVTLSPLSGGVSAVMYEGEGDSMIWTVYALPGASVSAVPAKGLPPSAKITSYSVAGFDFGPGFDHRNVDGTHIMTQLQRFTRSSATVGEKPVP